MARGITQRRRVPNRRLQELRINHGLSVNDLARRTGVSAASIRLAEKGFVPGPRIQFAVSQEFELRPLDLWPLDRQPVPR